MQTPPRNRREPTAQELRDELSMVISFSIVAIVIAEAKESGAQSGSMQCPRCCTGILRWAIASNGHVRGVCDRVISSCCDGDGTNQEPAYCVAFMQ